MSNESWLSAVSLAGDGDDRVIGARSITATWQLSVSDQVVLSSQTCQSACPDGNAVAIQLRSAAKGTREARDTRAPRRRGELFPSIKKEGRSREMQVAGIRRVGARVEMIEAGEPRPLTGDEVLLEVRAAGVGNWDEFVRTGGWDVGAKPPMALGVEAAGIVLAASQAVGDWAAWGRPGRLS